MPMDQDVVRKAPLFAALDDESSRALMDSMARTRLERGDVLFHQGEQGRRLYVIREGKVKLGRRSRDGRENLIALLGPGEIFGELSLFDPGPRTMTATAVAETQLLSLDNNELHGLLDGRPAVTRVLLAALAQRLRRTNESLADQIFHDVPGRVAKTLLDLAERFGHRTQEGILVTHDLTQEELAQLIGSSRETVNKALGHFANRLWLRREMYSVLLLDVERLQRRAS